MKKQIKSVSSIMPKNLKYVEEYYDIYTEDQLKSVFTIPELHTVESLGPQYSNYSTICFLIAKDENADFFDGYSLGSIDLIKNNTYNTFFLGQVIGTNVYDLTNYVKNVCQEYENYIMQMY